MTGQPMHVEPESENYQVASMIEHFAIKVFETGLPCVFIIDEDKQTTFIGHPSTKKDFENYLKMFENKKYAIQATIDEDNDYIKTGAYLFAETVLDYWLKYSIRTFIMILDSKTGKYMIMMPEYMEKESLKHYWDGNITDGYKEKGIFWEREWIDPDKHGDFIGGLKV